MAAGSVLGVIRPDLTALEEAKQTHVEYELGVGWAPICQKCHVNWPCVTARLIADHEALRVWADYWQILHEDLIEQANKEHQ